MIIIFCTLLFCKWFNLHKNHTKKKFVCWNYPWGDKSSSLFWKVKKSGLSLMKSVQETIMNWVGTGFDVLFLSSSLPSKGVREEEDRTGKWGSILLIFVLLISNVGADMYSVTKYFLNPWMRLWIRYFILSYLVLANVYSFGLD